MEKESYINDPNAALAEAQVVDNLLGETGVETNDSGKIGENYKAAQELYDEMLEMEITAGSSSAVARELLYLKDVSIDAPTRFMRLGNYLANAYKLRSYSALIRKRSLLDLCKKTAASLPKDLTYEEMEPLIANVAIRSDKEVALEVSIIELGEEMKKKEAESGFRDSGKLISEPEFRNSVEKVMVNAVYPEKDKDRHADKRENDRATGFEIAIFLLLNSGLIEGVRLGKGNLRQDQDCGIDGIVEIMGGEKEKIIFTYDATIAGGSILTDKEKRSQRRLEQQKVEMENARFISDLISYEDKRFPHAFPVVLKVDSETSEFKGIIDAGYYSFLYFLIKHKPPEFRSEIENRLKIQMETGGLGQRVRATGGFVLEQLKAGFEEELKKAKANLPESKIRKIDDLISTLGDTSLKTVGQNN